MRKTYSWDLQQYLNKNREVLTFAEALIRKRLMAGRAVTMGDVTAKVWLKSGLRTMGWQARAIISHAVKNGAFGNVATKPGVGFAFVQDVAGDRKRRSA